jgi:O-antigen/teichoic acid export membrane protein
MTAPMLGRRSAATNLVAQVVALVAVSLASLLVARFGGAAVLGDFTLLRMLPWLTGVICSCGLPVAAAYVLSCRGGDARVRPTLTTGLGLGCVAGVGVWLALTPLLHSLFFRTVPIELLALSSLLVITQLTTVWAKACCQGNADITGSNLIIMVEELCFLPVYCLAHFAGLQPIDAVVLSLLGGGICAASIALARLASQGFLRGWGRPSTGIARQLVSYGARAQLGNLLWLVNLRLDFLILGGLAGPAVLGVYAVATKFAEVMRLPATAANYVLYPRFARRERDAAAADARVIMPLAVIGTVTAAPLLAGASVLVIPRLFGHAFHASVLPACILLIGLSVEGAAAVSSALLCGIGRPGANSIGMGAGVVVTIILDVLLIPRHGAAGAAVASSVAYLVTTGLLVTLSRKLTRQAPIAGAPLPEGAAS